MTEKSAIMLFNQKQVRRNGIANRRNGIFSMVDVVAILSGTKKV